MDGETVVDEENFVLETEIEFQLRCLLHGTKAIRFQPRPLNLGHGRLIINKGSAVCLGTGCNGTGIWLTIDLYVVNSEKVPKSQWDTAMRAVLEAEMGAPKVEPEPEIIDAKINEERKEEEVKQTEQRTGSVQTRALSRPPLGYSPRV